MNFADYQNDVLREDEVLEILKRNTKDKKFLIKELEIKAASENPAGFLGEHYKMRAEVVVDGCLRPYFYFVKKIPTKVPQHLEYALKTRAFYKEAQLYKTLFEDMRAALGRYSNQPTKWHPDYFYSRGEEAIVLEDLTHAGYYMCPDRSLLDEEHVRAGLRALAAMHAASLVLESRAATDLGASYAHLAFETEASDEEGHPGNTYHEAGIRCLVELAGLLPGYSATDRKQIRQKLPDVSRRLYQLVKPSQRYKNVFVHGDLWSNNVLFRKDDTGKVERAVLIDFQLARHAPPAHDVMMFLHLVQNRKFRKEHQQEMLQYYYSALSLELRENFLRIENILPKEDFLQSCEHYEDLGLIAKLFYYQLILAPPTIAAKFLSSPDLFTKNMLRDRSEMVLECYHTDETCKERLTEALEDVINKFILV